MTRIESARRLQRWVHLGAAGATIALVAGVLLTPPRDFPVAAFVIPPLVAAVALPWRATLGWAALSVALATGLGLVTEGYEGSELAYRVVVVALGGALATFFAELRVRRDREFARVSELARARDERLQALARVEAVTRAVAEAGRATTADEAAVALLDVGRQGIGARTAAAYSLHGDAVTLLASEGYADEVLESYREMPLDFEAPVPDALRECRTVWIGDQTAFHARYPFVAELAIDDRSFVCAPMLDDGGPVGVVYFAAPADHAFDEDDVRLVETLAALGAGALRRALLIDALRVQHDFRDAVLATLHEGLLVADDRGVVLLANEEWCRLTGFTAEELEGVKPPYPWWEGDPDAARLDPRAEGWEPALELEVWLRRRDGARLRVSVNEARIGGGPVPGYVVTMRDITARTFARLRERALTALAVDLARAPSVLEAGRAVVSALPEALGTSGCALLVESPERPGWGLVIGELGDGRDSARGWRWLQLDEQLPLSHAMSTGEAIFVRDLDDARRRFPALPDFDPGDDRAWAVVPIEIEGAHRGCLVLRYPYVPDFDGDERAFLAALAAVCGQALTRASQADLEHRLTAALQRNLLPSRLPAAPGIRLAARYLPAIEGLQVGGDWYDAFTLPDGRLLLFVGDVAGHGVSAAAWMSELRSAVRALAFLADPSEILARLDDFSDGRDGRDGELTATAACAVLDPATRRLELAIAGHPPPLLRTADGRVEVLDGTRGLLLGAARGQRRPVAFLTAPPGSTLLLYTDGLVEQRDEPITDGIARLGGVLSAAESRDADAVCDQVLDAAGARGRDDIALLVAVCEEPGAAPR